MKYAFLSLTAITALAFAQGPMGRHIFEHLDDNQDGTITREEFSQRSMDHFNALDVNGDGVLTQSDLDAVSRKAFASMMFHRADGDNDGATSSNEWLAWTATWEQDQSGGLVPPEGPRAPNHQDHVIALLDQNENGAVEANELDALFSTYDTNGNGTIDEDELVSRGVGNMLALGQRQRQRPRGPLFLMRADTDDNREITTAEWTAFVNALEADDNGTIAISQVFPHIETGPPQGMGHGHPGPFPMQIDSNSDGSFTADELIAWFNQIDGNGDGTLTFDELHGERRHKGKPRHHRR